MIRWGLLSTVLLGLSVALAHFGRAADFTGFEGTLIAVNFTVAVLAINFAFVAYQSSEYRQFQRGLSSNLLFGCLCLLLGAMMPVIGLVFRREFVGLIGVTMLPITALLSVGLVGLAKVEASPDALIKRHAKLSRLRRAFKDYAGLCASTQDNWKKLELAEPKNMPMHEWRWTPLPAPMRGEPLGVLGAIGCIAAKAQNTNALVRATEALLTALEECYRAIHATKDSLPSATASLVEHQLQRLAVAVQGADASGALADAFVNACAAFLGKKGGENWPTASPCFSVLAIVEKLAREQLAKGNTSTAKTPLVVIRLLCEKGIRQLILSAECGEPFMAHEASLFSQWNLGGLAAMMQPLGTAAIGAKETDYLYRVFDAFGWLGCSALKAANREVTTACVRALAQLGREARAQKLECHWDHCAVRPEDHARERIEWIVSWVSKAESDTHKDWLELCSQGLSRLAGKVVKLELTKRDSKPFVNMIYTAEIHKEGFSSDAGHRELDYSDATMLKDFELHGIMGGVMVHSSPIPLFDDKDRQEKKP